MKFILGTVVILILFMAVTKQDFIHNYGKSAYEVRLELAMQFYVKGNSPKESFDLADEFLTYLKTQDK